MRGQGLSCTIKKLLILSIIGLFTVAELLYIPAEYKFGLVKAFDLLKVIFK